MATTAHHVHGRFDAQLLLDRSATDVASVVDRICAVQAQDLPAARLAIRARSTGLTASDVDAALNSRTHAVTWLNRGTLHLVAREDYWWLQRLTARPTNASNENRLVQEGVAVHEADRACDLILEWMADVGPMTRGEVRERLPAHGIRTEGQALIHILMRASLRGLIIRGPVVGREQAFVRVDHWWGEAPSLDRDDALAMLARRFLAGHAPADDRDLAKWSGLPLRDVRRGLELIAPELDVDDQGQAVLAASPPREDVPAPLLLGGFDPILMGWADRDWVLNGAQHVVTKNGLFLPTALVNGQAVATWRRPRGEIELVPFGPLSDANQSSLDEEAKDISRFVGD